MNYVSKLAVIGFGFLAGFSSETSAQVRITTARLPDGKIRISAPANPSAQVKLQATGDLRNWTTLQTFPANVAVSYTETPGTGGGLRSYRLETGGGSPIPPTTLPDLANLANRVFPAPEGFNTVQYASDGKLGYIFWKDTQLMLRERNAAGSWAEYAINNLGATFVPLTTFVYGGPRSDYNFQPSAALVYDSASRPHVFQAYGTSVIHYTRNAAGNFAEAERVATPAINGKIDVLLASTGANDVLHLAALSAGPSRNLTYGSTRAGGWNWTTISAVTDVDSYYWAPPYAPRWVSMAVDAQNNAHFAYRSAMTITKHAAGYPRAHSVLKYASNASGSWVKDVVVMSPRDISGEAANGASIAIAPDNKPRIVSWYNERADTGSSQESFLYFHQPNGSGGWAASEVARSPDSYAAGDGPKGTGFSPYLRYDSRGRAHILFLDHAGEHFSAIGQQEYAGNVRHAWWNGSGWSFETVYRQTNPLRQDAMYPSFALSPNGNELAVTVLQREANWRLTGFPALSTATTYTFRFLTRPLQ